VLARDCKKTLLLHRSIPVGIYFCCFLLRSDFLINLFAISPTIMAAMKKAASMMYPLPPCIASPSTILIQRLKIRKKVGIPKSNANPSKIKPKIFFIEDLLIVLRDVQRGAN